jgi:hypothetical protein
VKSLAEQLAELQQTAKALPQIQAELKRIEASVGKLNVLLGGQRAVKRGRRPKSEPKKARRGKTKSRISLKDKLLQALAKGPMAAARLKKVDGRAVPRTLEKWVAQGILKKEPRGLYSRP